MKINGMDTLVKPVVQGEEQELRAAESKRVRMDDRRDTTLRQKPPLPDEGERMLEELEEAVDKLNGAARSFNISLEFRLHRESDRWMVEVWEKNLDGELIKEIPPEKFLDMVASLQEMVGIMLDAHR